MGCGEWATTILKLKLQYLGHLMRRADSLKRPWCWERSKAGGEGDNRGWDSWMASPTQWTWVWVNSRSWWWTGRPGMSSQTRQRDWTELNYLQEQQGESISWKKNQVSVKTISKSSGNGHRKKSQEGGNQWGIWVRDLAFPMPGSFSAHNFLDFIIQSSLSP